MMTTIATLALLGGLVAPSAAPATDEAGRHYSLFGFDVCIGAPKGPNSCELRLFPERRKGEPAPPKADAAMPVELTLFGKKLCIGDVPSGGRCDWWLHDDAPRHGA